MWHWHIEYILYKSIFMSIPMFDPIFNVHSNQLWLSILMFVCSDDLSKFSAQSYHRKGAVNVNKYSMQYDSTILFNKVVLYIQGNSAVNGQNRRWWTQSFYSHRPQLQLLSKWRLTRHRMTNRSPRNLTKPRPLRSFSPGNR